MRRRLLKITSVSNACFHVSPTYSSSLRCTLVRFKIALRFSLQWYQMMAKCLRSVPIPCARRQPLIVAPAPVPTIVLMLHLTAVLVRGVYSIGNRFQVTYIVDRLHNDSNLYGCDCDLGCRGPSETIESKQQSLYKSYLCVELSFLYEDTHCFSREAGETRWVTAVRFTAATFLTLLT